MIEYLLHDFSVSVRSRLARIYLIGISALILVANIAVICFRVIYGSNEGTFAYNVFEYASWCFLIPYYSTIILATIAVGRQYIYPKKDGNVLDIPVAKGAQGKGKIVLKPWKIYVEKLLLTLMISFVFLVAASALLYVITQLFHFNEGIIEWMIVRLFLNKTALALPLWFAGISFAVMFLFVFEKKWKAYVAFALVTVVIPQIIRILSLDSVGLEPARMIRKFTITQNFGLVPYPSYPDRSVPLIVSIGIIYGVVAMVIGIVVYCKKADR